MGRKISKPIKYLQIREIKSHYISVSLYQTRVSSQLICKISSLKKSIVISLQNCFNAVKTFLEKLLYVSACATIHVWRSEGNVWELVFSFQRICPRDGTQIFKLGSRYLCTLSCLTGPISSTFALKFISCFSFFLSFWYFHLSIE